MAIVITKNKLTKIQMKERNLSYDGWGKKPHCKKDYYYIKKRRR